MMQGAFVLTAASFAAKILSAIYRVPYQNLVGNEGFYVYQQVYPIYGLAMTLALSGLPQFISKYVAEKKEPQAQRLALAELLPSLSGFGLILWGVLFFFSGYLAHWMGDDQLSPLIQVVSFTFVLMPFLAITRGELQGKIRMTPTAISQIVEQLIRVGVILLAAWCFKAFGWGVYFTGALAMSGALFGGVFAILVLRQYRRNILGTHTNIFRKVSWKNSRKLQKRLLVEGGLMTIYSGFLIFFQLVDSFTVKKALVDHGMSEHAAKWTKGVYDRGQPLVQLGLVLALALSASFLPLLTRYLMNKEHSLFIKTSQTFLRLTCSVAAAASLGLVLLLPYVNYALFKDDQENQALAVFVLVIFFMAMIQAYQSIDQSQNRFKQPMRAAAVGLAVKIATTSGWTKWFGTTGASLSTLLGLMTVLVLLHVTSEKQLMDYVKKRRFIQRLLLSLTAMSAALLLYDGGVYVLFGAIKHREWALLVSILGVFLGGSVFIFCAIRLKLLTIREWLLLPYGAKILRIKWKRV